MGPSKARRDEAADIRRQERARQARAQEEADRRAEEAERKQQEGGS